MNSNRTNTSHGNPESDLVDLKVKVPLALRRKIAGIHGETGRLMGEVTTDLLMKALSLEPTDEELFDRVFRKCWSPALYNTVDALRKAKGLSWTALLQQWAEQHRTDAAGLPPIAKPFSATRIAPPRRVARDGFLPGTQIVDTTADSTTEADSGIRGSLTKQATK